MKKSMGFIILICLFLASCATGEANRYYLKEKLPKKNIKDVEVLREAPTRPYIVIADFQAYVNVKHMQKRAAEIGADAVIVTPTGGSYSTSEIWAENDRYSKTYTRLIATAIKYKTE